MKNNDKKIANEYFFRDFGDLSKDSVVCDLYIKRIKNKNKPSKQKFIKCKKCGKKTPLGKILKSGVSICQYCYENLHIKWK